jgi:hypothetical protein
MVDALTRSERLFFVFITYVAVILVFAVIYLNIYRTRPTSFAFNKDILKTERRLLRVIRERDFEKRQANLEITRARLESELTVFRYCLGELEKDDPMVPFERDLQQDGIWITRKYRVFVRLEYEESQPDPGQAHGESIPYTRLVVEEKTDKPLQMLQETTTRRGFLRIEQHSQMSWAYSSVTMRHLLIGSNK